MTYLIRGTSPRNLVSLAAIALTLAGPVAPALAQDTVAETRIRKIEAEVRALQRKVFPGGDQRFFEPQITPSSPATPAPGTAATSAVSDLLTQVTALELQIAQLTAQIEQNTNRISQLEAKAAFAMPGTAAVSTPAPSPAPAAAPSPSPSPTPTPAPGSASQSNIDAMSGGASVRPTATAPTGPSAQRLEAVSAIVKPQTDDKGDDEYSYGFRLWDAKFYPEAQQQLKMFVDRYPSHPRTSWGRNLLGRAYLDDGNPREAAKWFLQNYQANKQGDRAPDSLLYLGRAMKELKDTKRACIALAEFAETYPMEAAGRLQTLYTSTRNGLDCSG